jgi:hypothetical protein
VLRAGELVDDCLAAQVGLGDKHVPVEPGAESPPPDARRSTPARQQERRAVREAGWRAETRLPGPVLRPRQRREEGHVRRGYQERLGLATVIAALATHHLHHLPSATWHLFAGSVISATLLGLIGMALGYITRSTIVAAVAAVGWCCLSTWLSSTRSCRTWASG